MIRWDRELDEESERAGLISNASVVREFLSGWVKFAVRNNDLIVWS
jgi:hypothetical protein